MHQQKVTNFMEHSLSYEANSFSALKKIPLFYRHQVRHHVYKISQLVPVLSQTKPFHATILFLEYSF